MVFGGILLLVSFLGVTQGEIFLQFPLRLSASLLARVWLAPNTTRIVKGYQSVSPVIANVQISTRLFSDPTLCDRIPALIVFEFTGSASTNGTFSFNFSVTSTANFSIRDSTHNG